LLLVAACSSDEVPEVNRPTPKLQVIEFATETPVANDPEPSATPTEVSPETTVAADITPTVAATVGVGLSGDAPPATAESPTVVPISFSENRPADVNPLTGLQVDDPDMLARRPLMVRIGNDPGARPQVALNMADVVYEEVVEWWVTRFTAIYLSQDPEMIAPIRSARLINLHLTPQYGGALVNSGGSDGVRWEISKTDIVNLDEFFVPGPYFYRPNEGWQTRLAIDATKARDYMSNEGLESRGDLRGFAFSEQLDLATIPAGTSSAAEIIEVPYPQQTSAVRWQYNSSDGKYERYVSGEPSVGFDGDQISATNVIVYFADHQPTDIVEDSNGATSIRIVVNGRGAAWLFRDGQVLTGNWETDGKETPNFIFDNGQPMPLKPGNVWIQIVPLEYSIDIDGASYSSLTAATSPGR
jgi:hypothetical protein